MDSGERLVKIAIPDGLTFADLELTRDPQTGGVTFRLDWIDS